MEPETKKLEQFLEDFLGACVSLQTIDGQTLVKDGELTDKSVPIKETRLSDTYNEAIQEAKYVETRKSGEKISPEETEKIERINRDILLHKSNGFIYGPTGDR
jgi:hypothetical protein